MALAGVREHVRQRIEPGRLVRRHRAGEHHPIAELESGVLGAQLLQHLTGADHEPAHVVPPGAEPAHRREQERDALEAEQRAQVGDHPLAAEAVARCQPRVAWPRREARGVDAVGDHPHAIAGYPPRQEIAADAFADGHDHVHRAGEARLQRAHGGGAGAARARVSPLLRRVLPEGADLVDAGHTQAARDDVRGEAAEDGRVGVDHREGRLAVEGEDAPPERRHLGRLADQRHAAEPRRRGGALVGHAVDRRGRAHASLTHAGERHRIEPERRLVLEDLGRARGVPGDERERAIEDVEHPHAEWDAGASRPGADGSPVLSVGLASSASAAISPSGSAVSSASP